MINVSSKLQHQSQYSFKITLRHFINLRHFLALMCENKSVIVFDLNKQVIESKRMFYTLNSELKYLYTKHFIN